MSPCATCRKRATKIGPAAISTPAMSANIRDAEISRPTKQGATPTPSTTHMATIATSPRRTNGNKP